MTPTPLLARGVRKRFRDTQALDGLDLEIRPGTVHALLGPNGAGKSTAVNVFATLTRPDAGEVRVGGHDAVRHPARVRSTIGLVGQSAALDEALHGRENLVLFGRLHGLAKPDAVRRATDLLDAFGLTEAGDRKVTGYSGGMRRRLDIAAGLVTRPQILFLDEPTTGLDPRARHEVWDMVRQVVADGTTVLLTTQYLDEADQLAEMVTVLGDGRVIAEGSPSALKDDLGGDRVIITAAAPDDLGRMAEALGSAAVVDPDRLEITVEAGTTGGGAAVVDVVRSLDSAGITVDDVLLRRPTLDEVFLHLTAPETEPETQPEGAAR
ncbi:ABC-2 type transport system ATP-binding protein [Nocardioides luteus]|uniref:Daunorubicin resistance protein DrrA family ABC transporter ATP-binding protein n=1 Tax=Nocardioides luteus TaxID=1844 RepID=A0ABQ5SVR4_9ACTN|nr:ATP-binding cassette domain-containing protein [Nocardioides luteus]MDR7309520.1 ABC-2 type transport system ATP-binding protein [Nocardioides luteus]GGR51801.1 daunorubicin resistance protein DrrA family ABC transporter ATP-binding protein [Nocardioides luteus]GLJ67926.1 daunorubicin resistance protein DrrA family ABC transporter ATP-binding protein [Nocardioides luteus]